MVSLAEKCNNASLKIRRDIIEMTYQLGNTGAHLGGSLSIVEILATLYCGIVRFDRSNPNWENRDRVILSKGHAALALYPALVQAGIIESEELKTFKKNESRLGGHPSLNGLPGIEFASGSLGQGLSLGVGTCLALKKKENKDSRVFVLMGDGEINEGSVWEAAASAAHYSLNQLVGVVDMNHLQYDGETQKVMNIQNIESVWKGFGWEVIRVNGHDVNELLKALSYSSDRPLVVLADTIKGKGISFMENNKAFHNSRLTKEQYELAISELEG